MDKDILQQLLDILDDNKATDIQVLDVRAATTITDTMIIASGRSDRQVKALAEKITAAAKKLGMPPLGVEGQEQSDWILIDLGDIILHIMRPATRIYYQLEKLWSDEKQQAAKSAYTEISITIMANSPCLLKKLDAQIAPETGKRPNDCS